MARASGGASRDRDREIVRQTAELLSSGVPLSDLFERFCLLLAQFVDSSVVFIGIDYPDGLYIEYAYDHGQSNRDIHRRVNPKAISQRVIDTGDSYLMRTREDIVGPFIPLQMQGAKMDDSQSAVFVPLRFGTRTLGVLSVQSAKRYAYNEDDLHLLETCALYVAVALHADKMRSEKDAFESAARFDALTGVANRRTFDERLGSEWRRAMRDGTALSLVLLDIDWFKNFNDTYGHVAGDACLQQIADAARGCMARPTDLFARYGGEEFAALLGATDASGATAVAERMRSAIRQLEIPHVGSPIGRVTASFGVATCTIAMGTSSVLVRTADRALYAAKTAGRDRVVGELLKESIAAGARRLAGNNLRAAPTSFLGRKEEVGAAMALLEETPVVSITGPGGVGKTRLALTVAQRRLYAYLDGVWLIDLTAIRDRRFIDPAVCAVLETPSHAGLSTRGALIEELKSKNCLLIFDNCEQVLEAVAELCSEIAQVAPDVRMLITSRERLGIPAEGVLALHPLDPQDAIELFVERARESFAGFQPSQDDLAAIALLVGRLDYLPLAIELAATRVRTLTPGQISERLDDRFRMLVSGQRATQDKQQTLYATLQWSYDLLDDRAQRLLSNLAVFPGSFDAEAARDICADDVVEPWDLLATLNDLIAKNLVTVTGSDKQERFRLLESTRHFATVQLEERGDDQPASRHTRYFRAFAQRTNEQIERGAVEEAVALVSLEWENVRAALDRSLVRGRDEAAGREILVALRRFFSESGRLTEGQFWIERGLATGTAHTRERGELLYMASLIAHSLGDFEELGKLGEELVTLHEQSGDLSQLARSLNAVGIAKFHLGNAVGAEKLYARALEKYRAAGDRRGVAVALMNLGTLAADLRLDYATARTLFEESLEIFRELGVSINIGTVLANLGEIAAIEGDVERGLQLANESLAMFERLGNKNMAAWQYLEIAFYRIERNELDLAQGALSAGYNLLLDQPHREFLALYFDVAFYLAQKLGEDEVAARLCGFARYYRSRERLLRLASAAKVYDRYYSQLCERMEPARREAIEREGAQASMQELHEAVESLRTAAAIHR